MRHAAALAQLVSAHDHMMHLIRAVGDAQGAGVAGMPATFGVRVQHRP
jgi:hypothetical protein